MLSPDVGHPIDFPGATFRGQAQCLAQQRQTINVLKQMILKGKAQTDVQRNINVSISYNKMHHLL